MEPKSCWVGLDWGDAHHGVCVLDVGTDQETSFTVENTAEALDEFIVGLRPHGDVLGTAVETPRHFVVQKLLAAGLCVYPVNPKIAKAWRDSTGAQPSKSDAIDASVLARGLAQHHKNLRPLTPDDDATRELVLLCDDEQHLIASRTANVNRLQATLKQYYPEALRWFDKWAEPLAWDFIIAFPDPEVLAAASRKKLIGFFRSHRCRLTPQLQERIDRRSALPEAPDEVMRRAMRLRAVATAKILHAIEKERRVCHKRIRELFELHPDQGLFDSLPGAGDTLAPRLLAGFGANRERFESAAAIQCLSGTVPVTKTSGKQERPVVQFRWACQSNFRKTLHLFAMCSKNSCRWAKAFYDEARRRGQSYGLALRNLANKWLKIIFRMWKERQLYDEARFLQSLIDHGSPLVAAMKT
jgi:transposase